MTVNFKSFFSSIINFFILLSVKKNTIEKLPRSIKAKNKNFLTHIQNKQLTKLIHKLDENIKFNNLDSFSDDLFKLKKNGFIKLSEINFEFDSSYFSKILDNKKLSVHDEIGVASVIDASYHFPELNIILESDHINNICTSYLGNDAKVNHIRVERLETNLSREDVSGLYHHDQIGHRLKILILLDDVKKDGRCTSYAVGTHQVKWNNYDYDQSRYDEEIIESEFEIQKFNGNKGDIYIFDTNGLHRREEKYQKAKRSVVFIDIASDSKCFAIKKLLPDKVPHPFPIGYYREQYFDKKIKLEKTLLNDAKITYKNDVYVYESD